jgi:hypothetical protein
MASLFSTAAEFDSWCEGQIAVVVAQQQGFHSLVSDESVTHVLPPASACCDACLCMLWFGLLGMLHASVHLAIMTAGILHLAVMTACMRSRPPQLKCPVG